MLLFYLANIIHHFFDLQPDFVYRDDHPDLFTETAEEQTLQDISAIVIGGEIKKIVATNTTLGFRIRQILEGHIAKAEDSWLMKRKNPKVAKIHPNLIARHESQGHLFLFLAWVSAEIFENLKLVFRAKTVSARSMRDRDSFFHGGSSL